MDCGPIEYIQWTRRTVNRLVVVNDYYMALEVLGHNFKHLDGRLQSVDSGCSDLREYYFPLWVDLVELLEFTIDLALKDPRFRPIASRAVCRYLTEVPGLYGDGNNQVQPRPFFLNLLEPIGQKNYSESDWHCAERALRFIAERKDRTFISEVMNLVQAHEFEGAGPNLANPFAKSANLGILEEVYRILKLVPDPLG
jgi:hypothetical protein